MATLLSDQVEDEDPQHSLPTFPDPLLAATVNENTKNRHMDLFSWNSVFGARALKRAHTVLTVTLAIALVGILIQKKNNGTSSSSRASVQTATGSSDGWKPLPANDTVVHTIAFGSCMKEDAPQPFWDTLAKLQPDVTILGGDNVYMPFKECQDDSCTVLKHAYQVLDAHPSFQGAKAQLPMVAQLDDHDYGQNDAYQDNPYKDIAKELFLDWIQEPQDSPRRRDNDGLYTYYEWGPIGKRVQLILLDTRYSRSPFVYSPELWGYLPDHEDQSKRVLSKDQWHWLEHDVLTRPANVRLVVSTIQFMAQGEWGFESWSLIPHECERLKELLSKYCTEADQPSLPIILSGDRHMGAFYYEPKYNLYEVTASSWTHTVPYNYDPDGVSCEGMDCIEPDPMRMHHNNAKQDYGIVWVNHFGTVQFHWQQRRVEVALRRAETSPGHATKTKWKENTDAGQVLKKISLDIP